MMAKVTNIEVMQQNAVTQGTRSGFMFQHIPCVDQQLLTGADKHVGLDFSGAGVVCRATSTAKDVVVILLGYPK